MRTLLMGDGALLIKHGMNFVIERYRISNDVPLSTVMDYLNSNDLTQFEFELAENSVRRLFMISRIPGPVTMGSIRELLMKLLCARNVDQVWLDHFFSGNEPGSAAKRAESG